MAKSKSVTITLEITLDEEGAYSFNATDGSFRFGSRPHANLNGMMNEFRHNALPILIRRAELDRKEPGRNDPCICDSGKKFKDCCLLKFQLRRTAGAKRRRQKRRG